MVVSLGVPIFRVFTVNFPILRNSMVMNSQFLFILIVDNGRLSV